MNDIIKHYRTLIGEALQAFDSDRLCLKIMDLAEGAEARINALGDRVNPNPPNEIPLNGWQNLGWIEDETAGFRESFNAPEGETYVAYDGSKSPDGTWAVLREQKFGPFDTVAIQPYVDELKKATISATEAYFNTTDGVRYVGSDDRWKDAEPKSLEATAEAITKMADELGIELTDWQRRFVEQFFPGTWGK